MRIAILMPGLLGCHQVAVDSILKNIIAPNNADVFIFTSKKNYVHASSEEDFNPCNYEVDVSGADEKIITSCFGRYLKYFAYSDDLPGYQEQIQQQQKSMKDRLSKFNGDDFYFNKEIGTVYNDIRYLDQFLRLKHLMPMVSDYDMVVKFRIDHILTKQIIIEPAKDNEIWCPRAEMTYLFWGNQNIMKFVCDNFLDGIGTYDPPRYLMDVSGVSYGLSVDAQFHGFLKKKGLDIKQVSVNVGWRLHRHDSVCDVLNYGKAEKEIKNSGVARKDYYVFHKHNVPYSPIFDMEQNILWAYLLYRMENL